MPKGLPRTLANAAKGTAGRPFKLRTYTVATAPSAATEGVGAMIRISNGSAGNPCLAVSDGTNWKVIATGATAAAS